MAGDGWLAVGDAAGLVDPVTGEGLYYAIRSGDLASQVSSMNSVSRARQARTPTASMLQRDFMEDLAFAAGLAKRFFFQTLPVLHAFPARMIEFMRRSPRFREIVQDLFAGHAAVPRSEEAAAG